MNYLFEDLALKLQATILDTQEILNQIQELGVDTTTLKKIIEQIYHDLNLKIDKTIEFYNANEIIDNFFKENFFREDYLKAIDTLTKLQYKLIEEYNIYSEIYGICLYIESHLSEINQNNISEYLEETKKLLKKLKYSSTVDYKSEEYLVKKVYQIVYQMIKLELIYTNQSSLLEEAREDSVERVYITKYIQSEIKSLDSTNKEYIFINQKLNELKKDGLKTNYLDKELLLLIEYTQNKDLINNKINNLESLCEEFEKCKLQAPTNLDEHKQAVEKYVHKTKQTFQSLLIEVSKLAGIFTLIASLGVGGVVLSKKIANTKIYKTTETLYDANLDTLFPTQTTYQESQKDATLIIQYYPWEESKNNHGYLREIATYDVTNIKYEDIKDYLSLDLNSLNVESFIRTEQKDELDPSDFYQQVLTQIKIIIQDKNISKNKTDGGIFSLLMTFTFFLELLISLLLIDKLKIIKNNGIELLYDYKGYKLALENHQKALLSCQKSLEATTNQLLNLTSQIEEEYEKLPEFLKKDKKISKILKKVKQLPNVWKQDNE